jgi:hypothetical protein
MDYNEIDVEGIVNRLVTEEGQGKTRNAKKETISVRRAALNAIVKKMQSNVENNKV